MAIDSISSLRQRWIEASENDKTIDMNEMQQSLADCGKVDIESMTDLMYEFVRDRGVKFTDFARTMAYSFAGRELQEDNVALKQLDAILVNDWLGSSGPVDASSAARLRELVKHSITGSACPEHVIEYLTGRLNEAKGHLRTRSGAGPDIASRIDSVMSEFRLTGEGSVSVPVHASQFMRAGRKEPVGTARDWGELFDKVWISNDFVAVVNDLIADGKLEKRDADFLIAFFEDSHPEPGLFDKMRPNARRRHQYMERDIRAFESALNNLPRNLAETGVLNRLRAWVGELRDAGRVVRDTADTSVPHTALEPPYDAAKGTQKGTVDIDFDYVGAATQADAIASISADNKLTAEDKIKELYRVAAQAQESLLKAATSVRMDGATLEPKTRDIKRLTSVADLQGSFYSSGGSLLFGLLSYGRSSSFASGSVRGHAESYEATGTCYDLSASLEELKNTSAAREAALQYRDQIAPHIADMRLALSAIVQELGDAKPEDVSPAVSGLLYWACTTQFTAKYGHQQYFGPTLSTQTESVDVVSQYVLPRLLGENH